LRKVSWRLGVSKLSFLPLEKHGETGVTELRKLCQLEEENRKLKALLAKLTVRRQSLLRQNGPKLKDTPA